VRLRTWRKARRRSACVSGDLDSRNPITGIAGCWARAASGHAAAAPPTSDMNSRRFTASDSRAFALEDSTPQLRQETAAVRDFNLAYVGSEAKNGLCGDVRCTPAFPQGTAIRRHA